MIIRDWLKKERSPEEKNKVKEINQKDLNKSMLKSDN